MKINNQEIKKTTLYVVASVTIVIILIAISSILFSLISDTGYDEDIDGSVITVEWEKLNVRTSPDDGEVIDTLAKDSQVTLTGFAKEFIGTSDMDVWYEIRMSDGRTGWVLGRALNWRGAR